MEFKKRCFSSNPFKFTIEGFIIDSEIRRKCLEATYNCPFSIGDTVVQVNIPESSEPSSPVDCFTFRSPDDALNFIKLNFKL